MSKVYGQVTVRLIKDITKAPKTSSSLLSDKYKVSTVYVNKIKRQLASGQQIPRRSLPITNKPKVSVVEETVFAKPVEALSPTRCGACRYYARTACVFGLGVCLHCAKFLKSYR